MIEHVLARPRCRLPARTTPAVSASGTRSGIAAGPPDPPAKAPAAVIATKAMPRPKQQPAQPVRQASSRPRADHVWASHPAQLLRRDRGSRRSRSRCLASWLGRLTSRSPAPTGAMCARRRGELGGGDQAHRFHRAKRILVAGAPTTAVLQRGRMLPPGLRPGTAAWSDRGLSHRERLRERPRGHQLFQQPALDRGHGLRSRLPPSAMRSPVDSRLCPASLPLLRQSRSAPKRMKATIDSAA